LVGQDLEKSARDREHVLCGFVTNRPDAIAQRGEQCDVLREDPEVALETGCEHEVSFLAEDATLRGDEFDLELVGHGGYAFASSSGLAAVASAAGATSADVSGLTAVVSADSSAVASPAGAASPGAAPSSARVSGGAGGSV